MELYKMKELLPSFECYEDTEITGKRVFNEIAFTPNTASP